MKIRTKAALAAALGLAVPATATGQASGPKATYWVSAETTSGMAAGGMGGMMQGMGGQPGYPPGYTPPSVGGAVGSAAGSAVGSALGGYAGSVVGGALGGLLGRGRGKKQAQAPAAPAAQAPAPARTNFVRSLRLELGSSQRPNGAPSAEHLIPAGLNMGPSLPLVTPQATPTTPSTGSYGMADGQRPKGRMMIYWGCGEKAAAAPIVIDFATLSAGKAPNLPVVNVATGTVPTAGKWATLGLWPNERSNVKQVPTNGSLVGQHTVRGNYSPEIRFALGAGQDFMAPLTITSKDRSPGGGTRLVWTAVPGATGYFAQVMGAREDQTMVMWTSSATAASFSALMDYVPPSEVRRLIASRHVLPPSTTQCIVPAEVVQAAPTAMLMMVAYGDEVNAADPPRPAKGPWHVNWTTKVRFKSTTTAMLGVPGT
ncbi:MAG TPA: hypothetical protein VF699_06725 [Caulobacteraceae bacterium]|jgi:hypothetical protein